MESRVHITLTVNLKDGGEINDEEGEAASLHHVSEAVGTMLDELNVKNDEWSSLVVVVVA